MEQLGFGTRESGDRIKGCDGACIHAVGSLARAGGWSITNVAAFPIFRPDDRAYWDLFFGRREPTSTALIFFVAFPSGFQHELWISMFRMRA